MPGGAGTTGGGQGPRNDSPANHTCSQSRSSNHERNASDDGSEEDSASQNEEGADVLNKSTTTEESENDKRTKVSQAGGDGSGGDTEQPAADNAETNTADEAHKDNEKMLNTSIKKAKEEGRTVSRRMKQVKEELSIHNLTRLKRVISLLQTAQNRVKETGKEIAKYNEKHAPSDGEYPNRCRKSKQKAVLDTDEKIDKAQKFLDEKSVEEKEKSPGDMKKMCMSLKPQTKLSDEMTLAPLVFRAMK